MGRKNSNNNQSAAAILNTAKTFPMALGSQVNVKSTTPASSLAKQASTTPTATAAQSSTSSSSTTQQQQQQSQQPHPQHKFNKDALQESLHAKSQKIDNLINSTYWHIICSGLKMSPSITSVPSSYSCKQLDTMSTDSFRKNMLNSGYARCPFKLTDKYLLDRLNVAIYALKMYGWPPHFILLFDEIWIIARLIQDNLLKSTLASAKPQKPNSPSVKSYNYAFNMDFLAWFVEPKSGNSSGVGPHRSRKPKDIKSSFYADGFPKHLTCWVPINDATTFNGCLYTIPKDSDPGYTNGDNPEVDSMLHCISSNVNPKEIHRNPFPAQNYSNFSKIRALPVEKGNCLMLSHRLIHWGGCVEDEDRAGVIPCVAMSFTFTDPEFEPPLIKSFADSQSLAPSIEQRLGLAAAQTIVYYKHLKLDREIMDLCFRVFSRYNSGFDEQYKKRINEEYFIIRNSLYKNMQNTALEKSSSSLKDKARNDGIGGLIDAKGILNKLFNNEEPSSPVKSGSGDKQEGKNESGLGIFKDIFKSNASSAQGGSSQKTSADNSRTASPIQTKSSITHPVESTTVKEKVIAKPVPPSSRAQKMEKSASVTPLKSQNQKNLVSPKKQKKSDVSMFKDELMAFDINGMISSKSISELLEQRRALEQELDSVPSLMCPNREERAKHLYSIFFNDDGTQKITGADLKNVVPIVCPDYSAVQRMAQGFYGNAKEFDNQGKMFGSIALDLIQNVPLFDHIPDDYGVLQSSAKRVGIKLKDNHLRSIGQAFNIFLREACYTYLLFFRTIIPTMVSHCSSNPAHKESFDMTLHSRRIQQDFQTTLCVLISLLPLGPLYSEPIVDVVDALFEAAREMYSPVLLADACHLMGICTPPREKWKVWRGMLESMMRVIPDDEENSPAQNLLKTTLATCKQNIEDAEKGKLMASTTGIDDQWRLKLDSLPIPKPWEITRVFLGTLGESTVSFKAHHISKLEINDVNTLQKVTRTIHERALSIRDRSELFAGFCVKLAYKLSDFSNDCTLKIMKQLGTKNRYKASKGNLFTRFLLRECQQEFFKPPLPKPIDGNLEDAEYQSELTKYNRRKIRNIRLVIWLTRMGMISPTIILTIMLPHLLRDPTNCSPVDIECAVLCLKMTGQALDKGYPHLIDGFLKRLKAASSSPLLDETLKDDIAYLLFRRHHNWQDAESFYSSDES